MTKFHNSTRIKKSIFLCFFLSFSILIQAKTFTVSNNPETPGQFTAVQAANDNAAVANGDTLLIQGSPIIYGDVSISKALTLIGPGHHPQKQNPLTALFNTINITTDNVKIYGLVVSLIRAYDASNSSTIRNNITISYCRVNDIRTARSTVFECIGNNWFIRNNIIKRVYNEQGYGILIHNNIITDYVRYCANSASIKNNLFIGNGITQASFQSAPTGGTIANNIFYNIGFYNNLNIGAAGNTIYQNNITYIAGSSFAFPTGVNGNIVEGNLENVDPLFINVPANTTAFNYEHNYRLQANSPGKNKGNDGTDIGPYSLTTFSTTGEYPQQPVIRTMSIQNPNVPSGGALRVSVTISRAVSGN